MRILITIFMLSILIHQVYQQKLVLVGGGLSDNNTEIYSSFIKLASKIKNPLIGIITAASSTSVENGQYYVDLFNNTYKVPAIWLPFNTDNMTNPYDKKYVDIISSLTGIFIGGGDQLKLNNVMRNGTSDSPALKKMRDMLNSGDLVVGGTSAGCAGLSQAPMVTGGESWDALIFKARDYISDRHPDDLSYYKSGGFGFFQNGYLDTHFGVRGRQGRMIQLIGQLSQEKLFTSTWGLGIDEDTAVVVEGNQGTVAGASGVYLFDLAKAKQVKSKYLFSNVTVSYLTSGDKINFQDLSVTIANDKQNIKGHQDHDTPYSPTKDIFSSPNDYDSKGRKYPEEFTVISTDLFNSKSSNYTDGNSYETNPAIRVYLDKQQGDGYYKDVGQKRIISYTNLNVAIVENPKVINTVEDYFDNIRIKQ